MKIAHLTTVDLSLRYLVFAQLISVGKIGSEAIGISATGPWVADLEEAGIRHIPLPSSTRGIAPLADIKAAWELWRILRRERPDILHTHNPKPGIYGRILGRLAGIPIVVNTVHGLYAAPDDPMLKRAIVYALEAIAARFSDQELVQSREDLALINRLRLAPRGRARLLGNGIDLDRFDPGRPPEKDTDAVRRELGIHSGQLVVGMVGRLVAEKGYPELFEAARSLGDEYTVVVVGPEDGDKNDALPHDMLEDARAAGVKFLGMRTDLADLYRAMDIFVLPSHREGFPRAAMEAAAMGLPLIATDIRGCREVVEHRVNGLLIPVNSPDSLAGAITELGGDPELRREMGAASRVKSGQEFDEQRVVQRVLDAYRDIAAAQGRVEYREQLRMLPPADIFPDGKELASVEPTIRRASLSDVPALSSLHIEGISEGFLARLGPAFMRRLYEAMVDSDRATVLVADAGRGPIGFVAGTSDTSKFYREFARKSGFRAGLVALPRLVRPSNAHRAIQTARYGNADASQWPHAELLSMAVTASHRSQGIGFRLGVALLDELSSKGIDRVKVVVGSGNLSAVRAYEKMGFAPSGTTEVHPGERSEVLVWSA